MITAVMLNKVVSSFMSGLERFGVTALMVSFENNPYVIITADQSNTGLREYIFSSESVKKIWDVNDLYFFAGRQFKSENSVIHVGKTCIGGGGVAVIAGPCAVENEKQIMQVADFAKLIGVEILRGGAFKPRTSPYSYQGMGQKGLLSLKKASDMYDIPIVTEVLDTSEVDTIAKYSDILQIGTKNSTNYALLKAAGETGKPVLLKRGQASTTEEFLMSAEYILSRGNPNVILCERGIRTFENSTRNTLDISAIPVLKKKTHLPVIVDPSHAAGRADIVPHLTLAAVAAGADGVMLEIHPDPSKALSDPKQALSFNEFKELMEKIRKLENIFR